MLKHPIYETYPARYHDAQGEETMTITNDGRYLRMNLRGVAFVGGTPDDFEPEEGVDPTALALFQLNEVVANYRGLCGCQIEYEMPMPLRIVGDGGQESTVMARLRVWLRLGLPNERGWLDEEKLDLQLSFGDQSYQSRGSSGWFEDDLLEIQALLPEGVTMLACINCAYSDYSPYGHGMLGMLCYRDCKADYLQAKTKWDVMRLPVTEDVQETYHCPQFAHRPPGTGYRG